MAETLTKARMYEEGMAPMVQVSVFATQPSADGWPVQRVIADPMMKDLLAHHSLDILDSAP